MQVSLAWLGQIKKRWRWFLYLLLLELARDWGAGRINNFIESKAEGAVVNILQFIEINLLHWITWLVIPLVIIVLLFVTWRDSRKKRESPVSTKTTSDAQKRDMQDAFQHIILEGKHHISLTIHRGRPGWPVMYPIKIHNTNPIAVDIVGFHVSILWNSSVVQSVIWDAPSRDANNGLAVSVPFDSQELLPAITISAHHHLELHIPVNVGQIANRPAESPMWTAKGTIVFRSNEDTETKMFNFNTDNYQFTHEDWSELGQNIGGKSFSD